ncbi:MAG: hypothetical protein JW860_13240 [Sedimentisphaerales bacterium]|nr:hypothetical protein [Sedimentisphaerales bacterium]
MIHFHCSQCGEALEAPDSMSGDRLQCPQCRYPEVVPESKDGPPPIAIEELDGDDEGLSSSINTFESRSDLVIKEEFSRPMNKSGQGATRVRTFHTKLTDNAIKAMDRTINEWVDSDPEIEVKFTNITVGEIDSKLGKIPNLIVTVWY